MPSESTGPKHELKRRLREAGLRATNARTLVLECLTEAGRALTHAEVCEAVSDHGYDRATLYRNLMDLTNGGLVNRTDLGDHLWRFELAGAGGHDSSAHPHFVCQECGDVSCLPDDAVSLNARRGAPRALRQKNVEIQIRGVCNDCG
ncbi:MAG: transcriptional repressor [Sandaracinaceae bacterium]|nr:transcriptional repressor [Sandaracinaceae bacterium]